MTNPKKLVAILKAAQAEYIAIPVHASGKRHENDIYAVQRRLAAALAENDYYVSIVRSMANRFCYPTKDKIETEA